MTTRAHIIDANGNAETVSGREFFTRAFGHPPRTQAEKLAEWRADCERFADMIEAGNDWAVPPPCLYEARKLVAERLETETAQIRARMEAMKAKIDRRAA